jgi:ribosome-binding factor A
MTTHRKERVGDLLLSFLAEQLRRMSDPRLQSVTLTSIDMAPDLKRATIYWTTHSGAVSADSSAGAQAVTDKIIEECKAALQGGRNLLKRRIGSELKLRYIPELSFRHDSSLDTAARIDFLLNQVKQREQSTAEADPNSEGESEGDNVA